jgi:hypothetical protein
MPISTRQKRLNNDSIQANRQSISKIQQLTQLFEEMHPSTFVACYILILQKERYSFKFISGKIDPPLKPCTLKYPDLFDQPMDQWTLQRLKHLLSFTEKEWSKLYPFVTLNDSPTLIFKHFSFYRMERYVNECIVNWGTLFF